MKRLALFAALSVVCAGTSTVNGQNRGNSDPPGVANGHVQVPDSSVEQADDHGLRAHTNHLIHIRPEGTGGPSGLSPAQILAAYQITQPSSGAGSGTIAIVDAFHYGTALSDFNTFSSTFGLPRERSSNVLASTNAVFQVVYANGHQPRSNCGWAQEAALDIEWAHAMAPSAKIVLVEAASNSFSDLFQAVSVANNLPGVQQVSMSWGGSEFSSESLYDSYFSSQSVAYFASSGDTGGLTIYPSVSPDVISAGGTTLRMSGMTFVSESGWSGSGGGPSAYEPIAAFQSQVSGLATTLGNQRGTPDWSFDADPATGVSVFDSTRCQGLSGWMVFGGTSVSSPSLAGIANLAASQGGSTGSGLAYSLYNTYNGPGYSLDFRDIASGNNGYAATTGWDFVTGIGSGIGLLGK
jgi:subtilase family serine protease